MSQLGRTCKVAPFAVTVLLLLGVARLEAAAGGKGNGSITGTVTGADGKPAAGITVGLYRAPPKDEKASALAAAPGKAPGSAKPAKENKPPPLKQTTTDARGQFAFTNVPPGEYHVTASAKGLRDDRKRVKIKAGEAQKVSLALQAKEPGAQ